MRVLITGSQGFVGRHLVESYERDGHTVFGLDTAHHWGPRYINLSLHSIDECLFRHWVKPDKIIHLAAMSHLPSCKSNPTDAIHANVVGTGHLLKTALGYWNELTEDRREQFHVVVVGSAEEYGEGQPEEGEVLWPSNMYAATKAAASMLATGYANEFGLPVSVVRMANVYGPGQSKDKFIPLVIDRLLSGQVVQLHNDGQARRDWLYIDDACAALQAVAEGRGRNNIFNLGGYREASVREIAELIREELGDRAAGKLVNVLGTSLSKQVKMRCDWTHGALSWHPRMPLANGIKETVQSYLNT